MAQQEASRDIESLSEAVRLNGNHCNEAAIESLLMKHE
jgi:hypothetical protein